jgi:hypothetical protein
LGFKVQTWCFALSEKRNHILQILKGGGEERNENLLLPLVDFEGVVPYETALRKQRNSTYITQKYYFPLDVVFEMHSVMLC